VKLSGIDYLANTPFWDGVTAFGLDTPREVLNKLGNPQDKIKSIHVAGTNGKGSVCCQLAAILYQAGFKVGQFCSPHLGEVNERCLINGTPVALVQFDQAILRTLEVANECKLKLSYFEITTIASFLCFEEQQLDWIVVEVGLGGRLDATNTLSAPKACAITSISFDHMHMLGDTLSAIAKEKAGIAKKDVPIFVNDVVPEAKAVISEVAASSGASVEYLTQEFFFDGTTLTTSSGKFVYTSKLLAKLRGYALKNSLLSVRIAKHLGINDDTIAKGLLLANWPGRLELLKVNQPQGEINVLLDAAHNPEGVQALTEHLKSISDDYEEIIFILSIVKGKDIGEMAGQFLVFEEQVKGKTSVSFILTESCSERATPAMEIGRAHV